MSAATAPAAAPRSDGLILVGNPNVGKSVVFGLLTGTYVTVSNYPGTTVEVTRGYAAQGARRISVTDTPGVNTLLPQSEDEQVTRDILLRDSSTIVQIADMKNLPRALLLSIELAEAGRPFVLCLNMADEAESRGQSVDVERLSARLGVDVVRTVATRREGTARLLPLAAQARASDLRVAYDRRVEEAVAEIEPLLPEGRLSRRSMALMLLAGDASLGEWLRRRTSEMDLARIEEVRLRLARSSPRSIAFTIHQQRLQAAQALADEVTRRKAGDAGRVAEALGDLAMHPLWGLPALAAVLWAMYVFVGSFGAGTAVDFLESGLFGQDMASLEVLVPADGPPREDAAPPGRDRRLRLADGGAPDAIVVLLEEKAAPAGDGPARWIPVPGEDLQVFTDAGGRTARAAAVEAAPGEYRIAVGARPARLEIHDWSGHVNPAVHGALRLHSPWRILTEFVTGPYGLLTMGITYAVAIVLPIVATFFLAFSALEDSGYLPRLAIMANRAFKTMGLNGKAVLPMVLGLGCDTMATLTTRILETRKERLIVTLLLALGVPCSAQLGVILGLLAGLSWKAAAVWTGVVAGVIVLVGWAASKVLPGSGSDFILEIPPLRVPALGNILTKTLARMEWYLKEAAPLFLIGTVLLFAASRTGVLAVVEAAASPIVTGVLGLPAQASEAFIIGFLRRDFGSAGLYRLAEEGLLDPVQIVVSLVTVTLFIPCIANFLMIVKERGSRIALLMAGFVFPFAILVGGTLNAALRALKVSL